ncbi:hypothetical protein [Shivajiella indica]|uniref:Uncharacterized protein n=1 Tax=Shivajiella indica TaxID=872115 RepID=A0ABW5B3V1_9BACT
MIILLNGMSYSLIQLDFSIHRERIAELFCVNQEKPELSCNGQCELNRRLNNAQDQEENKKTFVQEEISLVYILPEKSNSPLRIWFQFHPKFGVMDELDFIFINSSEFFHPPCI